MSLWSRQWLSLVKEMALVLVASNLRVGLVPLILSVKHLLLVAYCL